MPPDLLEFMNHTASFDLRGYEPAKPLEATRGVEVAFRHTRTNIDRNRIAIDVDLAAPPMVYVNPQGLQVVRLIFVVALPQNYPGPHLSVDFAGEPPDILQRRWLDAAGVATAPRALTIAQQGELIRKWFDAEKTRIKTSVAYDALEKQARLFFLELDRTTGAFMHFALEGELTAAQIGEREDLMTQLIGTFNFRLMQRVLKQHKKLNQATAKLKALKHFSKIMVPLLATLRPIPDAKPAPKPDPQTVLHAFARFCAGDFTHPDDRAFADGRPAGSFFFFFAEFAILAQKRLTGPHGSIWRSLLGPLIMVQRVYLNAYGPQASFKSHGKARTRDLSQIDRERHVRDWKTKRTIAKWGKQVDANVAEAFGGNWQ